MDKTRKGLILFAILAITICAGGVSYVDQKQNEGLARCVALYGKCSMSKVVGFTYYADRCYLTDLYRRSVHYDIYNFQFQLVNDYSSFNTLANNTTVYYGNIQNFGTALYIQTDNHGYAYQCITIIYE